MGLEAVPASWSGLDSLQVLDMSRNQLEALPGNWSGLPSVTSLSFEHNRLRSPSLATVLDQDFKPKLESLRLAHNDLTCRDAVDTFRVMSARLHTFTVRDNPRANCSFQPSPSVVELDLRGTSMYAYPYTFGGGVYELQTVRLGSNHRYAHISEAFGLSENMPKISLVDLTDAPQPPPSPGRADADAISHVEKVPGQLVVFGADPVTGLTCPRWQFPNLTANTVPTLIDARRDSFYYKECSCADSRVWDAGSESCVPCPTHKGVYCDPFVQGAVHSLARDLYPMMPGAAGRAARTGAELVGEAAVVRCHHRGVCLGDDAAWNASASAHSVPAAARFTFACGRGRDAGSRLCSTCAPGRWPHGASCMRCPGASVSWLFPVAMCAVAACAAALVWRKSARAASSGGQRGAAASQRAADALSALFLWVQLVLLLRSYSASATLASASSVGGGGGSRGGEGGSESDGDGDGGGGAADAVWSGVSQAIGFLNLPAAWDVSALRCVWSGFDFEARELFKMLSAPALAACAAAAHVFLGRRVAGRAAWSRLWYCVAFVAHATVLPVLASALSVWRCESPGAGYASYLVSAPDVTCGSGSHNVLRAGACASLCLYVAPLVVVSARALYRAGTAASSSSSSGPAGVACGAARLDAPLLEGGGGLSPFDGVQEQASGDAVAERQHDLSLDVVSALGDGTVLVLTRSLRSTRRGAWAWPLADLARNTALAGAVALFSPGSVAVPATIVVVLTVSLAAVAFLQPRSDRDNGLHVCAMAGALMVYQVGAFAADADGADGRASSPFAGAVLALLVVCVTGVLLFYAAVDFRSQRKLERRESSSSLS